jgi:hypothetical protein
VDCSELAVAHVLLMSVTDGMRRFWKQRGSPWHSSFRGAWLHARGHGVDGDALEAGLARSGRTLRVGAGERHVRSEHPRRKSHVKDAIWIADLLAHGLLRGSFVSPERVQELRDLTRTHKQLVRELTRHTRRIQKTLEDANVKLTEVIANVFGTSGRAIVRALIADETDPEKLVDLTGGRLKAPRARLVNALQGRITEHHRFMLKMHL